MDRSNAEPVFSEAMRRVLEAMVAGEPVPPEAHASLSEEERREVAALARTAHVTRLALNQPEPTLEMEAKALARAQATLATNGAARPAGATPLAPPPPSRSSGPGGGGGGPQPDEPEDESFLQWLARIFGKRR